MPSRVVVVGAGIAGLASVVALQRRGIEVALVEERDDASSGAGISIWPNALAALDEIGLGDEVRDAGGRVTAGAMRWRNGTWVRRPHRDRIVKALGEPLVVIRRAALTEILAGAVKPDTRRLNLAVTSVTETAHGLQLQLSDGTTADADAVVGADGTFSVIAGHLNGPLKHSYAGYTAWRGVAELRIDPELAAETLGPGVEFGHVPMGPDHTYWFATERAPEGATCADGELTYLRNKYWSWPEPVPDMLAATDPAAVLRHDIYDRRAAKVWSRGPLVLVGDAAHAMRPHLGQGGCQGLEDAAILAAFVDGADDITSAFARFVAFRRPRVQPLVRESALVGRLVNLRPAMLAAAGIRASVVAPEWWITRHLATIASRDAFAMPEALSGHRRR
ncbi:MAG TPA: FAD-dependent oxidoreductase [Mycobacterium sp.]|jgi:2-polyprenyl-6-methoxyphenol hydroxylase-like FAD-dependent oxidoreductase